MRVLFLSGDAPDTPDQGDRIRAHHLLRSLVQAHEVILLTAGLRAPDSRSPLLASCREAVHVPVSRQQMVAGALLHPMLPTTVAARMQGAVTRMVRELAHRHAVDVIYAYQHRMVPHAWKVPGIRLVADLTDSLWLYRRRMAAMTGLPIRLYHLWEAAKLRRFEQAVLHRADLTILASAEDAAVLRPLAPQAQIAIVTNGVDAAELAGIAPKAAGPVLIFVGHMGYPPNVDGLLAFYREAFPSIAAAVPDVRLLVVGKSPDPAVQALSADRRLTVTGAVPDVSPYLLQAAVAICPVRFGSGTRLKILEAAAAGVPVVSTAIGCEGLDLLPGRHLEVVGEVGEMAEPIIGLLRDPARRHKLSAAARGLVRGQYDWAAIGRSLNERLMALQIPNREDFN